MKRVLPSSPFRPAHSWRVVPLHHKHDAIYRSPGVNFREHPFYEVQRIARALSSLTSARRKSGLALVALLDVRERAEDDVCHLLGVRDTHRVGGALDLHNLAGLSALSHEAVERRGDVLVELSEHEPRQDRLPCRRPRALVERHVAHRPLAHGHQGGLLSWDVFRELLVVLLLADVEVGAPVGERDGPQRFAKRAARETAGELEGVLAPSGAKPATYMSALTFSLSRAALLMTEPP